MKYGRSILIGRQFFIFGSCGARLTLAANRIEREMMKRLVMTAVALLTLGSIATIGAQEGHPLKGSWLGEWKGNTVHGDNILLILDWDGKAVTGAINPGAKDAITLTKVTEGPVTPAYDAWNVRMEGNGLVIEGKVVNLGSYERTMSGTWTQNGQKGDFKLTRN